MDATVLKDFIQLGATFIIALALLVYVCRKLDVIDARLVRILTLLVVLTKSTTNFNDIEHVLQGDADKVIKTLPENNLPPT